MSEIKENTKLNIFQKIQKARVMLQKTNIKKSGVNKYSNYKYFELSDFLPAIQEICNGIGIYAEFLYLGDKATLTLYDVENIDDYRQWETPIEVATLKGCSTIQNIGGTQSYARRYLYMMAFEIAENDVLDNGDTVDSEEEEKKQKINRASVMAINKLIAETETDRAKFLQWVGVKKVEDITNGSLNICMQQLNKKKEDKAKADVKAKKEMEIKKEQQDLQNKFNENDGDFDF